MSSVPWTVTNVLLRLPKKRIFTDIRPLSNRKIVYVPFFISLKLTGLLWKIHGYASS
jgi:hypothetical protein